MVEITFQLINCWLQTQAYPKAAITPSVSLTLSFVTDADAEHSRGPVMQDPPAAPRERESTGTVLDPEKRHSHTHCLKIAWSQ